jgi:hypothetical protein
MDTMTGMQDLSFRERSAVETMNKSLLMSSFDPMMSFMRRSVCIHEDQACVIPVRGRMHADTHLSIVRVRAVTQQRRLRGDACALHARYSLSLSLSTARLWRAYVLRCGRVRIMAQAARRCKVNPRASWTQTGHSVFSEIVMYTVLHVAMWQILHAGMHVRPYVYCGPSST